MIERGGIGTNWVLGKNGFYLPKIKVEPWELGTAILIPNSGQSATMTVGMDLQLSFGGWFKIDNFDGGKTHDIIPDLFSIKDDGTLTVAGVETTLNSDKYNHIVCSMNATTGVTCWVNSQLKFSNEQIASFLSGTDIQLFGSGLTAFSGWASDLFYAPIEVNQTEVNLLYNNRKGADVMEVLPDATHNYRFNGQDGDYVVKNYGTLGASGDLDFGGPLNFVEFVIDFIFGNAVQLDGIDDFVEIPIPGFANNVTKITVSAWIYRENGDWFIIGFPNSSNRRIEFNINRDNDAYIIDSDGFKLLAADIQGGSKMWIAYVLDSVTGYAGFFINGVWQGNVTFYTPLVADQVDFWRIGWRNYGGNPAGKGKYTEVAVDLGHALTQQEATSIYNNGDGADYEDSVGHKPNIYYKGDIEEGASEWIDHGSEGVNGVLSGATVVEF